VGAAQTPMRLAGRSITKTPRIMPIMERVLRLSLRRLIATIIPVARRGADKSLSQNSNQCGRIGPIRRR